MLDRDDVIDLMFDKGKGLGESAVFASPESPRTNEGPAGRANLRHRRAIRSTGGSRSP